MDDTELYYQVAYARLQDQDARNRELEGKSISLLGAASLLVSIGALLLKDFSSNPTQLSYASLAAAIVMGVAFVGILAAVIKTLRPRGWMRNPRPSKLAEHMMDKCKNEPLEVWAGQELTRSLAKNEPFIEAKADAVLWAIWCVGILALALGALAVSLRF